jgi:hypothetical protein
LLLVTHSNNKETLTMKKSLKFLLILLCMPWLAFAGPNVRLPQVENPTRVLLIGNSYLYYGDSLHNHLRRMASAENADFGKKLQYKSATIGGAWLDQQPVDWLTTPGKLGIKEPFQLVILQDNSSAALSDKNQSRSHKGTVDAAKWVADRGGKVALYMPHAYVAPHKQANADNIKKIEAFYTKTGNELNALVIPVGLAFQKAYEKYPGIKLQQSYDGSHPSILGTYLAAATCYAAIYGKSPVGNSFDAFGQIDPVILKNLQTVAQDTVKEYFQH